ncbi:hypothetical protein O988_00877 [Pseudogymnoascus sp. VKM F-3808]|nr:hypothetical protein O988_00877 [Pseudogymnoascus sp. VKM F-3808]
MGSSPPPTSGLPFVGPTFMPPPPPLGASIPIPQNKPPLAVLLKNGGKYPPEFQAQLQKPNSTILSQIRGRIVELCDDNTVIKSGSDIQTDEINALRVARELQLPVPEVYEAHPLPIMGASIHMSYIPGETLEVAWPTMSPDQKQGIALQLRAIVDKMRSLSSDDNAFRSCGGGMIRDMRSYTTYAGGPFLDEQSFNDFVMDIAKSTPKVIREGLRARLRCDHRVVLTHGDLTPRNIIVQDNKITGLIDWEIAGWFPEYWEYVKFFHRPCIHKDWFDYALDIFSEPYIEDLINYEGIHRWLRP